MRTDTSATPPTILRKDYTVPAFLVDTVDMGFDLDPAATRIATRIAMRRNPASSSKEIVLFGEELELVQLRLNGKQLKPGQYQLEAGKLRKRYGLAIHPGGGRTSVAAAGLSAIQ